MSKIKINDTAKLGVIAFVVYLLYKLYTYIVVQGGKFSDLVKSRAQAEASSSTPAAYRSTYGGSIDTDKVEGIISVVNSNIWTIALFIRMFNSDKIVAALNSLSNVAEVKYAVNAYRTKYGVSLRYDVENYLTAASKKEIISLVQMNWT